MKPYCFFFIAMGVTPLWAQSPMSAQEFDRYTLGKTFFYAEAGRSYGAEEYLKNRRVRWSFLDGRCKTGHWYPDEDNICFVYEDYTSPQCWKFYADGGSLQATYQNDGDPTVLYEVNSSDDPLVCLGPEVGV